MMPMKTNIRFIRLLLALLFSASIFSFVNAQTTRYKVEFDLDVDVPRNGTSFGSYSIKTNPGSRTLVSVGSTDMGTTMGSNQVIMDEVKEYPFSVTDWTISSNFYINMMTETCNESRNVPYYGAYIPPTEFFGCVNVTVRESTILKLENLIDLRDRIYPGSNQIDCNGVNVAVVNPIWNFKYRLKARLNNGSEVTVLEYAEHSSHALLTRTGALANVPYNEPFQVWVEYVENPVNDYDTSDEIIYSFVPCPPELEQDPPLVNNPSCYGATDASINMTLKEELEPTKNLIVGLYKKDTATDYSSVGPQITLTSSDFNNRSYTFSPNTRLEDGLYRLEWLYDDGSAEGVSSDFSIDEPNEILFNEIIVDPLCRNGNDGSVTIEPQGIGMFRYSLKKPSDNNFAPILQTTPAFSNLSAGVYIIEVAELGNLDCFVSKTITLEDPVSGPVMLTTDYTQQIVDGAGTIEVSATGGNPTYTFNWKKDNVALPQTSNRLENLGYGVYTVFATDAIGCNTDLITITLEPFPPLLVSISPIGEINCEGDTAQLRANPTNGSGTGFSYMWFKGDIDTGTPLSGNTNTINAGAGSYSVQVTDDAFNTATTTYNLDYVDRNTGNPITNVLTVTISDNTDIECKGENNGRIALDISGGTGNYEVFWDGSLTPGPQDNNTLSYGNHTYEVFDGNCSVSGGPIFIDEPDDYFLVSASSTDATTNGGDEGTITLNITGGSGNYTYAWYKDGSAFSPINGATANEFEGFPTGNYQVIVSETNGSGCTATLENTIFIDEPGPLSLGTPEATVDPILCFGESTGRITANYTGTPPFEFVWYNVDTGIELKRGEEDFLENINVGNYSFTINDASNAGPISSGSLEIAGPLAALNATAISTPISCFGNSDGTITISANGGTGGLQYQITGRPLQNSPLFENLASGTYSATIIDQNGCTYNLPDTIEIIEPDLIQIDDFLVTPATFSGATDGQISIDVSGGATPYTYSWTGPGITIPRTTKDIDALTSGNYTVEITSPGNQGAIDGCYLTQTFFVSEPGPLNLPDLNPTNISCSGANDGAINSAAQGTGTIDYVWEKDGSIINGQTGPDLTNLGPGTYSLTVSDETSNPSVTKSVTLTEPTQLTAQAFTTDVTCFGAEDGGVVITPDGGTPGYNYSIDGGINYQNGNSFPGLEAGNHTVRVQDANLCTVDVDFTITEPQPIAITLDLQQSLSAANATDGAISITAFGGTGALTYTWTGPAGFTPPTDNSDDIADLPGGTYTLVITDDNFNGDLTTGCYFTQDFTITEPGELLVSLAQTVFLECNGNDFAEITATVQGGVFPYSLEWFDTTDGSNDLLPETSEIIGGLTAGTYFVRVTDANGIIKDSDPITLTEPDLLKITLENITNVMCNGEETGAIDISVSGGTTPYEFYWNNGANTEDITNVANGEYTIEVVDANSCSTDRTITISAPDNPLEISNVTLTDASEYQAQDGRILLEISGGQPAYNISWSRASDGANIGNTPELLNLTADAYTVLITDDNGCSLTGTYQITEPDIVEETLVQPICSGESNGSISLLVNQGNGNYGYSWSTGETTNSIANLPAGEYSVTITGLPNGTIERTYILENPLPLNVDLGDDRVLCAEQELFLDATVEDATATYSWYSDNGFISAEPYITVNEKGDYTVTVQSATGCTATGSISIDKSTSEISAELAVSSQVFVGETAVLVDISYPLPETTEWVLPEGAQVLLQDSDEAEIVFAEAGEYQVGIITKIGQCMAEQTKTIIVVANDPTIKEDDNKNGQRLVEDFLVYPNPTDGRFTADVNLTERGNISIKVFSLANNALMASEKGQGQTAYSIPFDISGLPSGVYAVLLETPYGNSLRKIIIR